MSEAARTSLRDYHSFNDFFTRELKADVRPIASDPNEIASPADGTLSEFGNIVHDHLLQAKGKKYSLTALLGGDNELATQFHQGFYATIYLAPQDYHCVHMPITGRLQKMIYVPGSLFSVNNDSAASIDNLFSRNERLICLFETAAGNMAVIFVGAMIVGAISTVWHGRIQRKHRNSIYEWDYPTVQVPSITLKKGEKIGHFELGSTVIILFQSNVINWHAQIKKGDSLHYGQTLGVLQ